MVAKICSKSMIWVTEALSMTRRVNNPTTWQAIKGAKKVCMEEVGQLAITCPFTPLAILGTILEAKLTQTKSKSTMKSEEGIKVFQETKSILPMNKAIPHLQLINKIQKFSKSTTPKMI